jgi:ribosomal protein S9
MNSLLIGRGPLIVPARARFNPLSLFASGDPGYWPSGYDPASGRLFQNTAGTTPVTAAGQPVGMPLDTSEGLALGPELVTNGGFDTATGWGVSAQSSITGGVARVVSIDGTFQNVSQNRTLQAGIYELNIDIVAVAAGALQVAFTGGGVSGRIIASAPGSYRLILNVTTTASSSLDFHRSGVTDVPFDNVSLKLISGNHATQATALARPTLAQTNGVWNLTNDGNDSLPATLPAGTYTVAWVNASGAVTITPDVSVTTTLDTLRGQNQADVLAIRRALTAQEQAQLTAYWQARYAA